jgi:hypothetical protein
MIDNLLDLLIATINERLRDCKNRLEIEEKSKEVASVQGHISGYKDLINCLCAEFGLTQVAVEDNGDKAPNLPKYARAHIILINQELDILLESAEWKRVLENVQQKTEEMKDFLLFMAENSRDLYITQAKRQGITIFEDIFQNIRDEQKQRERELLFDGDAEDEE